MTSCRIAAALLVGLSSAVNSQDPIAPVPAAPAARLSPLVGSAAVTDPIAPMLPPLLPVPQPTYAPHKPCLPCQTEYNPGHVYLPEASPDCHSGNCNGECHACRRTWVSADFLFGWSQNLADINRGHEFGVKANGGYWFDDNKSLGLDFGILNVHQPYHEIVLGHTLINSPLTYTTGDANLRFSLLNHEHLGIDGLVGYRFARLHEVEFISSATGFAANLDTRNRVNAAQVGLIVDYHYGAYFCEVLGKIGTGRNSEAITINGLLVSDSPMCVASEFGARVGYQLGEGVFGTLGYSFTYLSNVARPGRIDSDFYLHGFTIGLETRF
jgi:opacity protein-like surface antigen